MRAAIAGAAVAAALAVAAGGCGSSSSTTVSKGASGASGASGAAGVSTPKTTGQVRLAFEKPQTKQDAVGAFLLRKAGTAHIAQLLATNFKLPNPLTVKGVNGIGSGPFYSPKDNSITLPYSFAAIVLQVLEQSNPRWSQHQVGFAAGAVEDFFLEHEFGHALIANYNLPILGNEEDAADQIATVLFLNSPEGPHLAAQAAQFFSDFSGRQNPPVLADYADVHALDLQRADDILCDAAGSSRLAFRQVGALGLLPRSRLAQCPSEYAQAVKSFKQLLQPKLHQAIHLRPPLSN